MANMSKQMSPKQKRLRSVAKRNRARHRTRSVANERTAADLRIIGGKFRGSKLRYPGREETRPMKHRVREAIFNLVGPSIRGVHAMDLFAGTGAIGLEALSRGATSVSFVERHVPTAGIIGENVAALGVADRAQIVTANALVWVRREAKLPESPWAVFISPPYDFYVERLDDMLGLVERLLAKAPAESIFVVEADTRFDFDLLPTADSWDVRSYRPAMVGILRTAALDS